MFSLLLGAYGLLCAFMYSAFAHTVQHPYMDEPFHVGQTQAYCAGRWSDWDDKITTLPGLYVTGALVARARGGGAQACALPALRAINLVPALATPWLLSHILRARHPAASHRSCAECAEDLNDGAAGLGDLDDADNLA